MAVVDLEHDGSNSRNTILLVCVSTKANYSKAQQLMSRKRIEATKQSAGQKKKKPKKYQKKPKNKWNSNEKTDNVDIISTKVGKS